jgi:hypothetical protein
MRGFAGISHQEVRPSAARAQASGGFLSVVRALAVIVALSLPAAAIADEAAHGGVSRQAYADAWWTGPIVAASASTMPHGHLLIEPYVYDARSYGSFDRDGTLHRASGPHNVHSLTYMLYGISDRFSVGLIPQFGLDAGDSSTRRSGPVVGDLGLHAQYRLHAFQEGHWLPTTSLVLEEMLPTGRYDRLGMHPGDGIGGGHYSSAFSVYMQRYFWAPNGRIVRTRLDISYSHSGRAQLQDVSVYGTAQGFRGFADSGDGFIADVAGEYSVTRRWVVAIGLVPASRGQRRGCGQCRSVHGTGRNDRPGACDRIQLERALWRNCRGQGQRAGAQCHCVLDSGRGREHGVLERERCLLDTWAQPW